MMEKEHSKTYYFDNADYDDRGRRKSDGMSFRDVVKEFEIDFHATNICEYALNLYSNSNTMRLLAKSKNAAPFLRYGMDLTQGESFDAVLDPYINGKIEEHSHYIYVYGIDSAFMTELDEYGYPIFDEDGDIYPLTLLIDDTMRDGVLGLSVPTSDDGEDTEKITINTPKFEYA